MKYLRKILGVFVFIMVGVILLPNNVFATSIEEIKTSKELTLKSVPATSIQMLWILTESFRKNIKVILLRSLVMILLREHYTIKVKTQV